MRCRREEGCWQLSTYTRTHTILWALSVCVRVQSPDKHRQAIAELAAAAEAQRTYYAQLGSAAIDNDRKLEMIGKVGACGASGVLP